MNELLYVSSKCMRNHTLGLIWRPLQSTGYMLKVVLPCWLWLWNCNPFFPSPSQSGDIFQSAYINLLALLASYWVLLSKSSELQAAVLQFYPLSLALWVRGLDSLRWDQEGGGKVSLHVLSLRRPVGLLSCSALERYVEGCCYSTAQPATVLFKMSVLVWQMHIRPQQHGCFFVHV